MSPVFSLMDELGFQNQTEGTSFVSRCPIVGIWWVLGCRESQLGPNSREPLCTAAFGVRVPGTFLCGSGHCWGVQGSWGPGVLGS